MNEQPKSAEELYALALETWGAPAQVDMMIEEAAEFIVALRHWVRGRDGSLLALLGEAADLEIMLGQLRYLVARKGAAMGFPHDGENPIDTLKARKLARLEERLNRRRES